MAFLTTSRLGIAKRSSFVYHGCGHQPFLFVSFEVSHSLENFGSSLYARQTARAPKASATSSPVCKLISGKPVTAS
eukprot:831022-Pelagomonas_calceolata.AAC.1